jgi:mycofactocin biosynthetic radical S-adenosylmethionine protein MftC
MSYELTLDEFPQLFRDIIQLHPQKVVFTGGEPMLRDDIFEIARLFRESDSDRQIHLCLNSNGTLISDETSPRIIQAFDEVRLSLDGEIEINDALRGSGSYEAVMSAMCALRNSGLFPGISITVTSSNLPHLEDFLATLFEVNYVTEFHLTPFRPVGRGKLVPELVCSWKEAQEVIETFWTGRFGSLSEKNESNRFSLASCGKCGIGSYINILPDGCVYPCHVLTDSKFLLGNIKFTSLLDIVKESTILKELSELDFTPRLVSNPKLDSILKNAVCLGEIYRDFPEELNSFIKL